MALGMIVTAQQAQAEKAEGIQPYVGIGAGAFSIGVKPTGSVGISQKNTVAAGFLQIGVDFNDYIGSEIRLGITGKGQTTHPAGAGNLPFTTSFTTTLKLDQFYSYFAKLRLPLTSDANGYLLLGGTTSQFAASGSNTSVTYTKTGFSYGAGVKQKWGENYALAAEWVKYWTTVRYNSAGNSDVWGASIILSSSF